MPDAVEADARIGSEIAGYRIERLLGRGGMSVVYLARHERLDRRVALKLLAPELSGDAQFRERFLRESRLAASLDHPNVIPIYDADDADGVLFIAMRYVDGTDLGRRLAESGRLEPAEAVSILEPVAAALDAARKQGLVHRDVKPGNVLISDEGHVYLSDFGLTRRTEEDVPLTESGQFVGTMDYVAPEQIESSGVSSQTDVYSLSCVLFECLTGERPFRGDSTIGLLFAHLQNEPPSASGRVEGLPAEIDGVLARGMAKSPEERYATSGELAGEARVALGLSGEIVQPLVASGWSRRRLLVVAGLVAVVVAVAAVGAVLLSGGGDDGGAVGDEWSRVLVDELALGGSSDVLAVGLAAGEAGLVAVGTGGVFSEADAAVWFSPDGVSWTRVRDFDLRGQGSLGISGVAFGETGFVAVGWQVGSPFSPGTDFDAAVWTSPDGQSWERVVDPGGF